MWLFFHCWHNAICQMLLGISEASQTSTGSPVVHNDRVEAHLFSSHLTDPRRISQRNRSATVRAIQRVEGSHARSAAALSRRLLLRLFDRRPTQGRPSFLVSGPLPVTRAAEQRRPTRRAVHRSTCVQHLRTFRMSG